MLFAALVLLGAASAAAIEGEGPCRRDADCSVAEESSCCGCRSLQVRAKSKKRKKRAPPPACGCADYHLDQLKPGPAGEPPGTHSRCGPMPPPAADYEAVCRKRVCVGVHKREQAALPAEPAPR